MVVGWVGCQLPLAATAVLRCFLCAGNNQAVVQNIMTANYSWPQHRQLSEGARDLVQRILVAQASHRITIQGIMVHPWYLHNLPAELQV